MRKRTSICERFCSSEKVLHKEESVSDAVLCKQRIFPLTFFGFRFQATFGFSRSDFFEINLHIPACQILALQ